MIRAVIFDFNGVLIDDEHVHFELFRDVLEEEGVRLTDRLYHERYLGYDDRRCFQAALIDAGQVADRERIDALIGRKASRYEERAAVGLRVFPGAVSCVLGLAARWPLAINSGALRPEIEYSLRRLGIDDRVSAIVAAEDTSECKPDPEGYLLALDALRAQVGEDLEAGHCLVIEDSLAGVQSAKAAGMWAVGIPHTYTAEQLRVAGADAILNRLEELSPGWVECLFTPEVSP